MVSPSLREELTQQIAAERERLAAQLDAIAARLSESQGESLAELSTYDNHPADLGDETFERSKEVSLRWQLRGHLAELDAAVERLALGTYGTCERCGQEIPRERLEAVPEARCCVACAAARGGEEAERARPVEEELLAPPFGRTWLDDADQAGYDGEDAWQDVARYGTSETPSDVPGAGYAALYPGSEEDAPVGSEEGVAGLDGRPRERPDEAR